MDIIPIWDNSGYHRIIPTLLNGKKLKLQLLKIRLGFDEFATETHASPDP